MTLLAGVAIGIVVGASALAGPPVEETLQGLTGSNGRGLTGSNGRGLTGSNGRGLTGSNGRGLTGSNGRGLTGSNGRGLTGSNGRGLTGSNGRGLTGSNGRGLTGSNGRGLTGSNGRGLTGSNGRGLTGSNGRGLTGSNGRSDDGRSFGHGFEVAAMGVIESIRIDEGVLDLVVAGQNFSVSPLDGEFAVGDYVVAGAIDAAAPAVLYHVGVPYVPGVSAVRVRGSVSSVDASTGRVTVGALVIDYTQQLAADPSLAPIAGSLIEAVGVQPAPASELVIDSSGSGLSLLASGQLTANRQ